MKIPDQLALKLSDKYKVAPDIVKDLASTCETLSELKGVLKLILGDLEDAEEH